MVGEVGGEATKALPASDAQAQAVDDVDDEWQPRKTHAAFVERLLAEQRKVVAQAYGRRGSARSREAANEPPRAPALAERKTDNVIDLAAWRIRYYHNDHLGTPRELTGEDGAILWRA
ncbi:MAG: RHS domain-containing protein, partial [Sterolibacteriaceae bacterium]|nr:RHS domain-containing protein [Candidatus Methylophosphatis haderslevensis]